MKTIGLVIKQLATLQMLNYIYFDLDTGFLLLLFSAQIMRTQPPYFVFRSLNLC